MALREIGIRQWRTVLRKEIIVGAANGVALAITCGIAGALVPIILTRMGQDPATASSIILTTITDVAGFFSFLGTAMLLSFML